MQHKNEDLAIMLRGLDLGSSVAEQDTLLENARVETSVFTDLLNDRVDLIPGTKGSGKSALYRIFVDFLPDYLLEQNKVVIAHGVQRAGDEIFHEFNDQFEKMAEEDFVNFWCIYLVSLANEHFMKEDQYAEFLKDCQNEISAFRRACQTARIPEFKNRKSLLEVLGWVIEVVRNWRPSIRYIPPGESGELRLDLLGSPIDSDEKPSEKTEEIVLPRYISKIRETLEGVLRKARLSLWLMIDRLDEIFPRRSDLETNALRGLLRTLRIFESKEIRVKVFLRDDILEQIVSAGKGFTALTHVTARKADTLKWSEDQILTMIVKRLFADANDALVNYLQIDTERLKASQDYRKEAFYKVFPPTVHRGANQSLTLRWIYTHTQDGNGIVTPRDVIDLLTKAKQHQQDDFNSNPSGHSDSIIGPAAIQYGISELSKQKRTTYLKAEFPHLWQSIKKFVGGKTEYSENAVSKLFGKKWQNIVDDLTSIGVLSVIKPGKKRDGSKSYKIPFVYRDGLELTQGKVK